MALPVGDRTTAQLVYFFRSDRAVLGLRLDQASANKHGSGARSAAGYGEEPAKDDSKVGSGGSKSLYACICGKKGFSRPDALKRHIKEDINAPKHKCPICRQKFKRAAAPLPLP